MDNGQQAQIGRGKQAKGIHKVMWRFYQIQIKHFYTEFCWYFLFGFGWFLLRRNRVKMENDMCSSSMFAVCFAWQLEIKK